MAELRIIQWTVAEDLSISPTAEQPAGVAGEHNACRVDVVIPGALEGYALHLELISSTGALDSTDRLTVEEGKVSFLLPRAWTQDGGKATIRLVIREVVEGEELLVGYAAPGRIRFEDRENPLGRVKSILEHTVQSLVDFMKEAVAAARGCVEDATSYAGIALNYAQVADEAKTGAEAAANAAEGSAAGAEKALVDAVDSADRAEAAAKRVEDTIEEEFSATSGKAIANATVSNNVAPALRGAATGTAMVVLDDVSPLPHPAKITATKTGIVTMIGWAVTDGYRDGDTKWYVSCAAPVSTGTTLSAMYEGVLYEDAVTVTDYVGAGEFSLNASESFVPFYEIPISAATPEGIYFYTDGATGNAAIEAPGTVPAEKVTVTGKNIFNFDHIDGFYNLTTNTAGEKELGSARTGISSLENGMIRNTVTPTSGTAYCDPGIRVMAAGYWGISFDACKDKDDGDLTVTFSLAFKDRTTLTRYGQVQLTEYRAWQRLRLAAYMAAPKEVVGFYISGNATSDADYKDNQMLFKNIQIERLTSSGTAGITDFEPYTGGEYAVGPDGTAAVQLPSPVAIIQGDRTATELAVRYNRDATCVVEKLTQAIISLGGKV